MSDEMTPGTEPGAPGAAQWPASPEPTADAGSGSGPAGEGQTAPAAGGGAAGAAAMMPADTTSRTIVGSGLATAAIALIGVVLGAWRLDYFGLVLIVAGLAGAGVSWAVSTERVRSESLPGRDIELAAGIVAGVLSVLKLFEVLFDFDDLGDYGGTLGLILAIALAVTSLAMFGGAVRRWTSPREILVSGDRGTRLAYAGMGLVILGWLLMVTLGFWDMRAGVSVLTLVLLAAVVLRWASDPVSKRLPVAGAWIAVVLAFVATLLALDHFLAAMNDADVFDPLDWLFVLLYLVGIGLLVVGSVWTAYERTMDAQERSSVGSGDLS